MNLLTALTTTLCTLIVCRTAYAVSRDVCAAVAARADRPAEPKTAVIGFRTPAVADEGEEACAKS